jgi:hypothetical protein
MDKWDAMYAQDFNRKTNLMANTIRVTWHNHSAKNSQLMIESESHLYNYNRIISKTLQTNKDYVSKFHSLSNCNNI